MIQRLVLALLVALGHQTHARNDLPSRESLEKLVNTLRSDDYRVMRWDAAVATADKQDEMCGSTLVQAMEILDPKNDHADNETRRLALEYATFCITDNPKQRDIFAHSHKSIHKWVLHWVTSEDNLLSATASHVVYIATYTNAHNHQEFIKHGAVSKLGDIVTMYTNENFEEREYLTVQIMWAAIALGNLAASYCDTPDDGCCYWDWQNSSSLVVEVNPDSLPVVSDGAKARKEIISYKSAANGRTLIDALLDISCRGPVPKHESVRRNNPYPGGKAVEPRDNNHPNLIVWAAAGAVKNILLGNKAAVKLVEPHIDCFCYLSHSGDWLEAVKGSGALEYLRRGDPCYFDRGHRNLECIDERFVDEEGYSCADYDDATDEECQVAGVDTGVLAVDACCGCGGGNKIYGSEMSSEEL